MERVPASTGVFDMFGLIPAPGVGLAIQNQRIKAIQKGGKRVVRIEGDIVNVSGKAAVVPRMLGIIRDKKWQGPEKGGGLNHRFPKLRNKERISFATEVPPPEGSVTFVVTFDQRR